MPVKPKEYITASARFLVYENYIVAEPNQYVDVSHQEVDDLHDVVKENMKGPFGLIENRPNETSINPMVYKRAKELMPDLKAFALVSNSRTTIASFKLEQAFMKGIKSAIYASLDDAKEWMESVL